MKFLQRLKPLLWIAPLFAFITLAGSFGSLNIMAADDSCGGLKRCLTVGGKDVTTATDFRIFTLDSDGSLYVRVASSTVVLAASPTQYMVTLTSADTQYSQALTQNTRGFEFQNRNNNDLRWSFATATVATPSGSYFTLKAGMVYFKNNLILDSGLTLYFANDNAGDVVELMTWE